ncbi:FecR family protein [Chryseobacterium shigense]|uniref:Ferric-dicitrate binding protein FerR (Iron transport regulator) n=1 Tax=Chryseobacterium shigense TaxID=297244 RepID=A0A841N832_9FLAO|nr:FecR family protein [Chryseobacterium shigense]MBB6371233.1 ferric-dicitrate binding protein FerR (iron transport regulator) [Chryseobacterium shigense]
MEEEHYKKNWEETYRENQTIDPQTDARIKAGINRKIKAGNRSKKIYWAAAAAVFIIAGFIFYSSPSHVSSKITVPQPYLSVDYTKRVELPDGSIIILDPHSTLTLSPDFGKTDRKIKFTGKATFSIAKDKSRPFRLNAGDFTVQVLGTKFFLDQTKGKQKVELLEGKVKINHKGKITYLLPNEAWNQNEENIVRTYYAADVKRNFSFEDENFEKIIAELEDVYNIRITYPQQYSNKKIKGTFSGNLDEVLSAICYPFNLNSQKKSTHEIELK